MTKKRGGAFEKTKRGGEGGEIEQKKTEERRKEDHPGHKWVATKA